jgi:putative cardiolipin synthase
MRRLIALLAALVPVLLGGCGTLAPQMARPPTFALRPSPDSPLVRITEASRPSPEQTGFRLMPLGAFSLDARIQLAQRAKTSLDVQYYLIQDDRTGRLLLRSLRDAALRGVRVRLLVDDLYTSGADPLFIALTAVPNVEVRLFNPFCCGRGSLTSKYLTSLADFGRLNHRMHNKLFIADGTMAIAGGRNIADEYFMRSASENFVDMDAFLVGAVVPGLARIFDTYWNSVEAYPAQAIIRTDLDHEGLLQDLNHRLSDGEQMMSVALPPFDILGYGPISEDLDAGRLGLIWGKAVAFADPPDKVTAASDEAAISTSVTMNVMDLIKASHTEVYVSSPYFIPGRRGLALIADLHRRKVHVTVLTNSLASSDEPLVHTGYARYRTELIKSGVDLYELSPTRIKHNKRLMLPGVSLGRLHAKTVVIDRKTVFIGSMNLDPRSAHTNTELGVIADSPELAREVIRVIQISKLQSAYRLRFAPDAESLQWLTSDGDKEVVLSEEPDTSAWMRVENMLLAPFVPEENL